ncbi:MAG TPA: hypothetical protein VFE36_07565 [Candidatus Baltobacteraceae bacterium]|nr:hypothetical protein [Candidatus Baltobacteraceae bacterium]
MIPAASVEPAKREVVAQAAILRITVRQMPTPTPPRPPKHVVSHVRVIAPIEPRVVAQTTTGKSARREVVHHLGAARPKPPKFSNTKPIWDIPVGAQGAGAGKDTGAGSVGTGDNGTGAGNAGNGNGAAAGNEPCGFVDFNRVRTQEDATTHHLWEWISVIVHFPDRHAETIQLDYPFYYPDKSADPFAQPEGAVTMLFQWPPDDKRASEPPLVQYVMQHSRPPGFTLLKDCPTASSNP